MIVALIVAATTALSAQTNLLPNPGFEDGLTGWALWGRESSAIARDEAVAHGGQASARLPEGHAALYAYVPLTGGRAYRVSGHVRFGAVVREAAVRFALCAAGKGNSSAGTRSVVIPAGPPDAWLPFEATLVPSADTVQSQVTLCAEGGPVWFDDLSLTATAMPAWADPEAGAWDALRQARAREPLYEELLTDRPGGYEVTMWGHALQRTSIPEPQRSQMTDAQWEEATRLTFRQMGQNRLNAYLLPWGLMGADTPEHFWRTPEFLLDLHQQYSLRFDVAAEPSAVAARAATLGAEVLNPGEVTAHAARPEVSPVDPAYVTACREELQRLAEVLAGRPYVRTVVGQDEPFVPAFPGLRSAAGPFMQRADEEVRQSYGHGRHGMPAPADPEWRSSANPALCWIAFNRWMADRYAEAAQQKFELARRLDRDWRYIPCDFWLMSGLVAFDYSRMAKYADLMQGDPYASSAERTRGRGMYNHGFGAKLLADLGHGSKGSDPKPVEVIVQAFDYAGYEVTPEDLLEWCSQALRCGATSLSFYASDNPRFTDDARWQMMLHIARTVSGMDALNRPAATRTAILYCNTAHAAEGPSASGDEVYATYALLGEKLGCWFDLVDELQLQRGLRTLNDYRIIYLPLATYAEPALPEALTEWVRAGGTLVCGDPTAFSRAPDGSDLSPLREALVGARLGAQVEEHALAIGAHKIRLYPRRTAANPTFTAHTTELGAETEVLGQYPGGDPAVVRHKLGEGSVIYFAANPFTPASVCGEAPLAAVLKDWQEEAGELLGQSIWQFRLPPPNP